MNSIAMPRLACRSFSSVEDLRLHGDVERGRRLVGDEQVGLGWRAPWRSSRAGAGRRRAGADRRRAGSAGSGMPTSSSSATTRGRGSWRAPRAPCSSRISPTCCSIVCSGLSDVIGSWNTMVMALAADAPHGALVGLEQVLALEQDFARGMRGARAPSSRAIDSAVTDLPEPDSPTSASVWPCVERERDAVDRQRGAAALREGDREVADGEEGRVTQRALLDLSRGCSCPANSLRSPLAMAVVDHLSGSTPASACIAVPTWMHRATLRTACCDAERSGSTRIARVTGTTSKYTPSPNKISR